MCHFRISRRVPGEVRINVIISTIPGVGTQMLEELKALPGVRTIRASCPADLPANAWYARQGFVLEAVRTARTGRELYDWVLHVRDPHDDRLGNDPKHVKEDTTMLTVLRAVRQAKGLTQKALAERAGVHAVMISAIETARWVPSRRTLDKLGAALDLAPDDLLRPYDEWLREKILASDATSSG
jgi:DNA-binding XRE family transcriptional regulator